MCYRETGDARYLARAVKSAEYILNHPNLPKDGVPYWDFDRPGEERDASAGAVIASGLLELSEYVPQNSRAVTCAPRAGFCGASLRTAT